MDRPTLLGSRPHRLARSASVGPRLAPRPPPLAAPTVAPLIAPVSGHHVSASRRRRAGQRRPNQTRAGIESALRPWANKVYRVVHPTSAGAVVNRLALSP